MSRIGRLPINISVGVKVEVQKDLVKVAGPKGECEIKLPRGVSVELKENRIFVLRKKTSIKAKALHGTFRSLIANMVRGVNEGWIKELEMVGTGYRAEVQDKDLVLTVGYSHPVKIKVPEGISFRVEKTKITVEGINKEKVGQISAEIRAVKPPEPYKGKGIMYIGEIVRRKAGKAAKTQAMGA